MGSIPCVSLGFWGGPIGDRFRADLNGQTSSLFERGVILAPVADAVRGFFLFHILELHDTTSAAPTYRFVQQNPL